ncbi:hypothetical protein SAMN05444388_107188 [Flavobacterium johnsoniae]|uniref:Uncharacterized protein n=1 Tax=Flavobacterium johnsoniae TaxID=986 RepID=A0A1M5QWY5_FLAJO|nr:hypothetical protein SAMN05444388_107188 [Flavobacterium johnsoniae]
MLARQSIIMYNIKTNKETNNIDIENSENGEFISTK